MNRILKSQQQNGPSPKSTAQHQVPLLKDFTEMCEINPYSETEGWVP